MFFDLESNQQLFVKVSDFSIHFQKKTGLLPKFKVKAQYLGY